MKPGSKQSADTKPLDLTRLELIALTLTANGLDAAQIAARLGQSDAEVEDALSEAERKLGAANRMHAVTIAVRKGLIGIEVKG